MKRAGRFLSVLLCLLLMLSLCACGSRQADRAAYETLYYDEPAYRYDYDEAAVADEA